MADGGERGEAYRSRGHRERRGERGAEEAPLGGGKVPQMKHVLQEGAAEKAEKKKMQRYEANRKRPLLRKVTRGEVLW